jgi:uncharacterized protein (DUF1810 family)
MNTSGNLQRFLDAQLYSYGQALLEIKNGLKQSHWIWYVFPQLKGLGHSYNSEYYGIRDLDEAREYYGHPVLGSRLLEITGALLEHAGKSAQDILSPVDAIKVKSCMTLFWLASGNTLFKTAIDTFYHGEMDGKTLQKCGCDKSEKQFPRIHGNPFKVDHLDFLIADRALRGRHCSEDSRDVIALYNFFGRWFSKRFITDRIQGFDKADSAGAFRSAFQELDELFRLKCEAEEKDGQVVSIDTEMLVEINNLCHFNEMQKMFYLLKKYFFKETHSGEWGIFFKSFELQHLSGLPKSMLLFHWNEKDTPHLLCFISASESANLHSFHLDYSHTNGNDFGSHDYGEYGFVEKDLNIEKIVHNTGADFTLMFRMDGDNLTSFLPPLIRHKYHLRPLRIPGDNFALGKKPEFFDKYYDLYRSGNWNAKHAIERGGFNLNG